MSKRSILLVEDDKNIAKLVKYNLEKEGFLLHAVEAGEDALKELFSKEYDIVILDLMLPGIDGLEVCREIKQSEKTKHIPVIMLTAKGEEVDRIVGFELGASDYVVKPFSPRELALRVKSVLKRSSEKAGPKERIKIGKVVIDTVSHSVKVNGKEVMLTLMEFDLLHTLMGRAGRVQSRERLLSDVWGIDSSVTTRTVDTHIKRLREKLAGSGECIETVRGIGYKYLS